MSEVKKNASAKGEKAMDKDKEEVLENIMAELEQEAKDKEQEEKAETSNEAGEQEAAGEPASENGSEDSKEEDKKKGLFNKKEKKNPLQEKVDELNDKVLRQMAEFENFRKRTDKEKAQQFELGQSNILEKLLPLVDNFERRLAAVQEAENIGAFADGIHKI